MTREEVPAFIRDLLRELHLSRQAERVSPSSPYGPNTGGWENPDLESFLDAMASWFEDMDDRLPISPSWGTFRDMLLAAKAYE
jgi:hypothetical protein